MNEINPPKVCIQILRWFCPDQLLEEIEGDLVQQFGRDVKLFGVRKAERRFVWNVIRLFRPEIILRNRFSLPLNQSYLLTNYFKIALRNMMGNKVFSLINISGLAVGMVAFFLILQYVSFEMSYDQFHQNKDEIYRVAYSQYENNELKNTSGKNFIGIRDLLKNHFPEIKNSTGFWPTPANIGLTFGYRDKVHLESSRFINADSNFFKVFPSLLKNGDAAKILTDTHNLVISEKAAKRIFGDEDPINKHLVDIVDQNNDGSDYVVAGILKDLPANSHFHGDFVSAMGHKWDTLTYYWDTPSFYTYVTIAEETDVKKLEERLNVLLGNLEKEHPSTKGSRMFLQPLTDIHLRSQLQDELEGNGNTSLVYVLSTIGLVILIIAWINYVNLETTQFISKTREIGVRRVIGSTKYDLGIQFLVKYFCVSLLAIGLALTSFKIIIPYFSYLTGIPIHSIQWMRSEVWLGAFLLFLIGSVFVGIYPALFLLNLNPVESMKGNSRIHFRGGILQKSLVIIQFTSSIVLIAFLLVVHQQLDFMRLTNKKVELDQVISLQNAMAYADEDLKKSMVILNFLKINCFKVQQLRWYAVLPRSRDRKLGSPWSMK